MALLGVELNDEVLFDREVHIFASGDSGHSTGKVCLIQFEPCGGRDEGSIFTGQSCKDCGRTALFLDSNDLAGFDLVGRDVYFLAIYGEMTVSYKLASLTTSG